MTKEKHTANMGRFFIKWTFAMKEEVCSLEGLRRIRWEQCAYCMLGIECPIEIRTWLTQSASQKHTPSASAHNLLAQFIAKNKKRSSANLEHPDLTDTAAIRLQEGAWLRHPNQGLYLDSVFKDIILRLNRTRRCWTFGAGLVRMECRKGGHRRTDGNFTCW